MIAVTIDTTTIGTEFRTRAVKSAAEVTLVKLQAYIEHLDSSTAQVALFLDPRRSSIKASNDITASVHDIFVSQYAYAPDEYRGSGSANFNLFVAISKARHVGSNEINDFSG